MSDGLCHNTCDGKSAFAIVQGSKCWCSDYVPDDSTQTDTSDCNQSCPGFPDDTCGGDGVWGYIALDKEPSGTKGSGDATSTAATSATTQVSKFFALSLLPPNHPQARGLIKSNLPGPVHARRCGLVAKCLPLHLGDIYT